MKRRKTQFDQKFWWRPGQSSPKRAPDWDAAVGN